MLGKLLRLDRACAAHGAHPQGDLAISTTILGTAFLPSRRRLSLPRASALLLGIVAAIVLVTVAPKVGHAGTETLRWAGWTGEFYNRSNWVPLLSSSDFSQGLMLRDYVVASGHVNALEVTVIRGGSVQLESEDSSADFAVGLNLALPDDWLYMYTEGYTGGHLLLSDGAEASVGEVRYQNGGSIELSGGSSVTCTAISPHQRVISGDIGRIDISVSDGSTLTVTESGDLSQLAISGASCVVGGTWMTICHSGGTASVAGGSLLSTQHLSIGGAEILILDDLIWIYPFRLPAVSCG